MVGIWDLTALEKPAPSRNTSLCGISNLALDVGYTVVRYLRLLFYPASSDHLVRVWDALEVRVCKVRSEDGPVPVRHGDQSYFRQPSVPVGGPCGYGHVVVASQVVPAHHLHVDRPAGDDDSLTHRPLGGRSTPEELFHTDRTAPEKESKERRCSIRQMLVSCAGAT